MNVKSPEFSRVEERSDEKWPPSVHMETIFGFLLKICL